MRNVAIVGVGLSEHVAKRRDVNMPELVYEAVKMAYDETDLTPKDIDAFYTGNMPAFEGMNMPELWGGEYWGAYKKPLMRITTGGTTGGSVAQGAYYAVASGLYDTVMAIAFEKQSDGDTALGLGTTMTADIFAMMNYGMPYEVTTNMAGSAAGGGAAGVTVFQATSYMHRSGCTTEHLDKVSALCRNNAAKNPYAHLRKFAGITPEEVAKTPMIAYPLRFGHVCPASDGACAMIFTTEENARKICERPAWIKSCASGADECAIIGLFGSGSANVDPAEQRGCKMAAKKAYKLAGISDPEKEIDLTEIYQPYSSQHLLFYERLFLCKEGGAPKALDDGVMELDGDLPTDPSGGTLSTNAIGASAMERVAYCALQIMGKAGDFQVPKDVHNAVAHGWGGSVNLITVTVLGDTPRKR